MSSKKKVKPPSRASDSTDNAVLAERAKAALSTAHFKEAIEHFKELLKRERQGPWLEGLAEAYAGRAGQLAAKGMIKEALALWRTRSESCGVPLLGGPYVDWLLKAGQIQQALGLLASVEKLPPEAQAHAHTQLAAAMLVAPDALLADLAAESPLLRQRAAAREAVSACIRGDEAALGEALQTISFRSPYRDLRPLLKALALQASDPQQAAASLARVAPGGPFEPLARALRVCLMSSSEWLGELRHLDEPGRTLVLDLKGCPPAQRSLVQELAARLGGPAPSPLELCDLMLRHPRSMDEGTARQVSRRLLPHAPQRMGAFRTKLVPLAAAEQEQILALAAELKQQYELAETHWLRLVDLLGKAPSGAQRAAQVLRRLADSTLHREPDGQLCEHSLDWLARSLELDPDHRDTHLRLVRNARQGDDLRQARTRLDVARQRFPDDPQLLQEAVEIALASGAFKKAAGLAKQVLKLDPINPRVRTLIGQAHVSHARKQIETRNLGAARRELDEAATWLRSASDLGLVKLLRGLAAESAADGDFLLREALAELGGPLVGAFHLLQETARVKLESKTLLRRAGVDLAAAPRAADVVALAHVLNATPEREGGLAAAFDGLRGALKAASALRLTESEHLLVCEALHRHGQHDLTRRFANAALRHWPQRLAFAYLAVAAGHEGEPWRMSASDVKRLERVEDQALAQGDQRTAARVARLLDTAGYDESDEDFPDPENFDTDTLRAMLMEAFGGEERFLEMARKQLGPATFERLRSVTKGDKTQLANALLELMAPDDPVPQLSPPRRKRPPARAPRSASENQPDLFDE